MGLREIERSAKERLIMLVHSARGESWHVGSSADLCGASRAGCSFVTHLLVGEGYKKIFYCRLDTRQPCLLSACHTFSRALVRSPQEEHRPLQRVFRMML